MNTFALEEFDRGGACTIYTVNQEPEEELSETETEKFFGRYLDRPNPYKDEAAILAEFLSHTIANEHGALKIYCNRDENYAQGFPPKRTRETEELEFYPDFPLRLYCLRISDSILILFNGGVKINADSAQNSEVSMFFQDANIFAKRILKALRDKTIKISKDGKSLESFDGKELLIN